MPAVIHDLLTSPFCLILARVVLTSFFRIAGLFSFINFVMMAKGIAQHELPAPRLVLALMIVTELTGSALLITDFRSLGWLGAGALGSQMASVACMIAAHFARSFRFATGSSPHVFVSHQRLTLAKIRLLSDDSRIGEIDLAAGFSSQANFTRAFRKSIGITPAQFRAQKAYPNCVVASN